MKKISTVQVFGSEILKEQKLTIGVDPGDRRSFYCVLDEAGKIILERKVAMTPEATKETFEKIPRSLIAMETGTHSPWNKPAAEGWDTRCSWPTHKKWN
jgi:transposase